MTHERLVEIQATYSGCEYSGIIDELCEPLQRAMSLLLLLDPEGLPAWQQHQLDKLVDEWLGVPSWSRKNTTE